VKMRSDYSVLLLAHISDSG